MMESEQIPPSPDSGHIVVFSVRRDTAYAECGRESLRGSMIMLNKERNPRCLACADFHEELWLERQRPNNLRLRIGRVDFLAAEIESCVQLD
jgi:hypothetical protein